MFVRAFCSSSGLAALLALAACEGAPELGLRPRPGGTGPEVKWDLYAKPLPEVPTPSDLGTWPDPDSPTGRRLNLPLEAPTRLETRIREKFNALDGWGTFAPISVSFTGPLDVANLRARHQGDDYAFADDAVYLVNLTTGVPVPLDLGNGNFPLVLKDTTYFPYDPRAGSSNLLYETVEEDQNQDGILQAEEDTDFDGVLDHPNTDPPNGDPVNDLLSFYERETNTLVLRPVMPLEEQTEYAVVLTRRLTGPDGQPVRPPASFAYINHPVQTERLRPLAGIFATNPAFGGLTLDDVAFAWTFTTQNTTGDLVAIRRGLDGTGPFAALAAQFPPVLDVQKAQGGIRTSCTVQGSPFVAPVTQILDGLRMVAGPAFGISREQVEALLRSYGAVDYVVVASYESPDFMNQPAQTPLDRWFRINRKTGDMEVDKGRGQLVITIPKVTAEHRPPFPSVLIVHGTGSSAVESLAYAGFLASRGLATVGITGYAHGLDLPEAFRGVIISIFDQECLGPMAKALQMGRSFDVDGDGVPDPSGAFWSGYLFNVRDAIRQTVVDIMQAVRILRSFDGLRRGQDFDGDGVPELAGDFNADGVPDLGGPAGAYYIAGGSLGGIVTMIAGAVEPSFRAAVPISGAGGLEDVPLRSTRTDVREQTILRLMGPLVLGDPGGPANSCAAGQTSLRFLVPGPKAAEIELACAAIAPGDTVVEENLRNHEVRCVRADAQGRFQIAVPSDALDPLALRVYSGLAVESFAGCRLRPGATATATIDKFGLPASFAPCRWSFDDKAAAYTFHPCNWKPGQPLQSPTEGLGLRRQTPEFRRLFLLGQTALESGDPINYARRYLEAPLWPDAGPKALLSIATVGDSTVPISTGAAFARAAGLIDLRTPDPRYGKTPNRILIERYVLEGISGLRRNGSDKLFDVDDIDEGHDGFAEPDLAPPLRLHVSGPAGGMSAAWFAYVDPRGSHAISLPDPARPFDMATYLLNLAAVYLASGGTDLRYVTDPAGHRCLANSSCPF